MSASQGIRGVPFLGRAFVVLVDSPALERHENNRSLPAPSPTTTTRPFLTVVDINSPAVWMEQTEVELLRDDSVMSVTVPLSVSDFLCPVHFGGRAPSYFVLGGLVFTVMSAPYLEVRPAFCFLPFFVLRPERSLCFSTGMVARFAVQPIRLLFGGKRVSIRLEVCGCCLV